MTKTAENNKRIAKNTGMLYVRMLLIMIVSLYTSRVVLKALGVEDFGIYNAVGGFISMFAIISSSLTTAISRYLTFEMGKTKEITTDGNAGRLQVIFSTSVIIQLLIGVIIIVLCETVGLWFLNTEMSIPSNRLFAANVVYQCSVVTFFVNLVSVPYNALIVAHERMSVFAYIGIFQAFGLLTIAFLIKMVDSDALINYAVLIALLAIIIRIIYGVYCGKSFPESKFKWVFDKRLLKEIFGFAGWNFIGASSGVLRTQGVNVLINIFCGPAVNAARGLAVQVNTAVSQFVGNFTTALNPQITKSYAANDHRYSFSLVFQGTRFSLYLMIFLSLPIIFETPTILHVWLHDVPVHTVMFVRLVLVYAMIEGLSGTMTTLMLATGRIRNYQLIVGGLQLLHFPIAYVVLKLGFEPEWTYVCAMFVALLCLAARLYMLRSICYFPISDFLHKVLWNVLAVAVSASILPFLYVKFFRGDGFYSFLISIILCVLSVLLSIAIVGCSGAERVMILGKVKNVIQHKIRNRHEKEY